MFERLTALWDRRRQKRREAFCFESKVIVSFDESGISAVFPEGQTEAIEAFGTANRCTSNARFLCWEPLNRRKSQMTYRVGRR